MRDYVYPVRAGGSFTELRYSLRSLEKNVADVGDVYLVGALPKWAVNVKHIPCRPGKSKWHNIPLAIRRVCDEPLSSTFVYMNDDIMVLKPFDEIPVLHRGSVYEMAGYIRAGSQWNKGHRETARFLRDHGHVGEILCYDLHVPMPMVTADMAVALDELLAGKLRVPQYRTFYGNRYRIGGARMDDVKPGGGGKPRWDEPFMSTSDFMFDHRRRRPHPVATNLKERFPLASKYEADASA